MHRNSRNSRFASVMALSLMAGLSITAAGTATADNPEGASAPRAPVWYITKEKSLVGNEIHEAGVKVQYAGLPADNLTPTCDEGRARAAEYKASNDKRVASMVENYSESQVGNPEEFMKSFLKAQAEERIEHQAQMAKMMEIQQESAVQLAQAAANMAELAKLIASQSAAPAVALEKPADAPSETSTEGTGTTPAKRTRG
jgi:hypothetical protein